jgi:hypothetical protein
MRGHDGCSATALDTGAREAAQVSLWCAMRSFTILFARCLRGSSAPAPPAISRAGLSSVRAGILARGLTA